ncbi:hypothetical protein Tco_0779233 [Tanacetum coccineum]
MGRGTWYYSLGVFLAIVDAFVRSEFEISSWRGAKVGVRTYLLGGAIDGSEANGIIRNPKLELESSCFAFDLVPLSYESVDVVVGENWLLRHKAEMSHVEDDRGVTEGREECTEVFQQRGSGAKEKLSEMLKESKWVNEPILVHCRKEQMIS